MVATVLFIATHGLCLATDSRRRICIDGRQRRLLTLAHDNCAPEDVLETVRRRAVQSELLPADRPCTPADLFFDRHPKLVGVCLVDLDSGYESALGDLDPIHKMWTHLSGDQSSRVMLGVKAAATLAVECDVVPESADADLSSHFFVSPSHR